MKENSKTCKNKVCLVRIADVMECDEDELDALQVRIADTYSNRRRMDPYQHESVRA